MSSSWSPLNPAAPAISFTETKIIASLLPVDADSGGELRRLAQGLAQRRVWVDVRSNLPRRGLDEAGQRGLGYQLARVVSDYVGAQKVAGIDVVDDLRKALCFVLNESHCVIAERIPLRLDVASRVLRLFLRQSDGCDLRMAVSHARHPVVVETIHRLAADRLGGEEALGRGHMRQQQSADGVAGGGDGRFVCLVAFVYLHPAALDPDAGLVEP